MREGQPAQEDRCGTCARRPEPRADGSRGGAGHLTPQQLEVLVGHLSREQMAAITAPGSFTRRSKKLDSATIRRQEARAKAVASYVQAADLPLLVVLRR